MKGFTSRVRNGPSRICRRGMLTVCTWRERIALMLAKICRYVREMNTNHTAPRDPAQGQRCQIDSNARALRFNSWDTLIKRDTFTFWKREGYCSMRPLIIQTGRTKAIYRSWDIDSTLQTLAHPLPDCQPLAREVPFAVMHTSVPIMRGLLR
jgi:hypothetical protein